MPPTILPQITTPWTTASGIKPQPYQQQQQQQPTRVLKPKSAATSTSTSISDVDRIPTPTTTANLDACFNDILQRDTIATSIMSVLSDFDTNCGNVNFKKGIYIYGSPGCGKTRFVIKLLESMNYDVIKYDAGDVRNKTLIDTITSNNVSNRNVLQMMQGKVKKIAVVMDEIDGMNNGDKGGITSLIKLIRQKKTKKQRSEDLTLNPIICIGNYYVDKKMKELMKVCNSYELKAPTREQMRKLLSQLVPFGDMSIAPLVPMLLDFIQGDLRKLSFIGNLYRKNARLLNMNTVRNIFQIKSFNEDSKKITQTLLNQYKPIHEHGQCMNETDRTIVALLWHENIVDLIETDTDVVRKFTFYRRVLNNMCFADYIDRVTFQSQIWQFNELSSLIKTFHNNQIYHTTYPSQRGTFHPPEVRFTKVLTKYSTEYNNSLFVFNLCQDLDLDRKDAIAFFQEMRLYYGADIVSRIDQIPDTDVLFDDNCVSKLDIKRMYRYLDKNVKKETGKTTMHFGDGGGGDDDDDAGGDDDCCGQ